MTSIVKLHPERPAEKRPWCETPTMQDIHTVLSTCQRFGRIGLIIGPPGIGKTTAIQAYAGSAVRNQFVAVHRLSCSQATLAQQIAALADSIGVYVERSKGTADDFKKEVAAALRQFGQSSEQPPLLVVDDAQAPEAPEEFLDVLRELHDRTGIALVLVGNTPLLQALSGPRKRGKAHRLEALNDRIMMPLILKGVASEDIDALCNHHALAGVQPRRLVKQIASSNRRLRGLSDALMLAESFEAGASWADRFATACAMMKIDSND